MGAGAFSRVHTIFFHPDCTVGFGIAPNHAFRLVGWHRVSFVNYLPFRCLEILPLYRQPETAEETRKGFLPPFAGSPALPPGQRPAPLHARGAPIHRASFSTRRNSGEAEKRAPQERSISSSAAVGPMICSQGDDLHIIVLHALMGRIQIVTDGRPDAGHLVAGNGGAHARPAEHDSPLGLAPQNRSADQPGNIRKSTGAGS